MQLGVLEIYTGSHVFFLWDVSRGISTSNPVSTQQQWTNKVYADSHILFNTFQYYILEVYTNSCLNMYILCMFNRSVAGQTKYHKYGWVLGNFLRMGSPSLSEMSNLIRSIGGMWEIVCQVSNHFTIFQVFQPWTMCFCPDQSQESPASKERRRLDVHWGVDRPRAACCCRTHPRPIMEVYAMQGLIGVNKPFNEAWFVCFFLNYFEVSLDFHQFLWFQNKPHVWPHIWVYLGAFPCCNDPKPADARSSDADSVQEKCWISTAHSFILT